MVDSKPRSGHTLCVLWLSLKYEVITRMWA